MDNKTRQKKYRQAKQNDGWKYFSVMVPEELYVQLKKIYIKWKLDNVEKGKK